MALAISWVAPCFDAAETRTFIVHAPFRRRGAPPHRVRSDARVTAPSPKIEIKAPTIDSRLGAGLFNSVLPQRAVQPPSA